MKRMENAVGSGRVLPPRESSVKGKPDTPKASVWTRPSPVPLRRWTLPIGNVIGAYHLVGVVVGAGTVVCRVHVNEWISRDWVKQHVDRDPHLIFSPFVSSNFKKKIFYVCHRQAVAYWAQTSAAYLQCVHVRLSRSDFVAFSGQHVQFFIFFLCVETKFFQFQRKLSLVLFTFLQAGSSECSKFKFCSIIACERAILLLLFIQQMLLFFIPRSWSLNTADARHFWTIGSPRRRLLDVFFLFESWKISIQ